jgi:hypothetical protein
MSDFAEYWSKNTCYQQILVENPASTHVHRLNQLTLMMSQTSSSVLEKAQIDWVMRTYGNTAVQLSFYCIGTKNSGYFWSNNSVILNIQKNESP